MNNKDYLKKILSANIHIDDKEKLDESLNELLAKPFEEPSAYQQFVTGANGVPKWEERTHYKQDRIALKLSPKFDNLITTSEGTYYSGGTNSNDPIQSEIGSAMVRAVIDVNASDKPNWVFYWDGVRYEWDKRRLPCVFRPATTFPFGMHIGPLGDKLICEIEYLDNQDHILEFELASPEIRQIDEEFFPSTIPSVHSASVGQTVVVKAVDENGRPTEWEAVDISGVTEERVNELINEALAVALNTAEAPSNN